MSDDDLGENTDVRFQLSIPVSTPSTYNNSVVISIDFFWQTDGIFSVNAQTGVVSLARSLDYDTTSSYSVLIIAQVKNS